MRRTLLWMALAFCAACVETKSLQLPEGTAGRSAIFVVAREDRAQLAWAADERDLRESGVPIAIRSDEELYVVLYDLSLEEMALSRGPVLLVSEEPARRILAGGEIYLAPAGERSFRRLPSEDGVLSELRIAGFGNGECEAKSGCFRLDGRSAYCEVPCRAPESPLPPEQPASIALTPCAPGFVETDSAQSPGQEDSVQYCVPPGDRFSIGPECAADGWPILDAGESAIFVRAGGAGDGSREAPYGTIAEALLAAGEGALIALGRGNYPENVRFLRATELRGACAKETQISGRIEARGNIVRVSQLAVLGGSVSVTIAGGSLELLDVVIADATRDALFLGTGTRLMAQRVSIDQGSARGVVFEGAAGSLEDLSVRETRDMGVAVVDGSTVTVDRLSMELVRGAGIYGRQSQLTVRDVFIRAVSESTDQSGEGMLLHAAEVNVERAWVEQARRSGISALRVGLLHASQVTLADVNILETVPVGEESNGLKLRDKTGASVERVSIRDMESHGVYVETAIDAPLIALRDLLIQRTGRPGILMATNSFTLERTAIAESSGGGIEMQQDCTNDVNGDIEDLSIRSVRPLADAVICGDELMRGTTIGIGIRGCLPQFYAEIGLSRFQVETQVDDAIGVCLGLQTRCTLSNGRVANNGVGLLFTASSADLIASDVVLEDNALAPIDQLGVP